MEYAEAVKIGKELVAREGMTKWDVGDLLNELVPVGAPHGAKNNSASIIKQWMEDVESPWSFQTLRDLRLVTNQWPKEKRSKASHGVHAILSRHPDRFRLIRDDMTIVEARQLAGHKMQSVDITKKRSTPEQLLAASNGYARSALKKLEENGFEEDELERLGELLAELDDLRDELGNALGMVLT